jgi:spore coat protein U-like protein
MNDNGILRHLCRLALLLACALGCIDALAQQSNTCTASNTTINFGSYDVISGNYLDGVGSFTVTCVSSGNAGRANITWTAKLAMTTQQLAPASGSDRLAYALYVDSARTQAWGDGTGGTGTFSDTLNVPRNGTATSAPITFYGRVSPGGQDVAGGSPPASYSQTLTVTVTCTGGRC